MINETTIKVPKKYEGMIERIEKDGEGYWAYSKEGFEFADMGCHTAHEYNQKDLLAMIRTLEPCNCKECKAEEVVEVIETVEQSGESMGTVDEFLALWKEKAHGYYMELRAELVAKRDEVVEVTAEGLTLIPKNAWGGRKYTNEQIEDIMSRLDEMPIHKKEDLAGWIKHYGFKVWVEKKGKAAVEVIKYGTEHLNEFLDKEVERKKEALIARIEKKAGQIVDASALRIGDNSEINGLIVGDKTTVKVNTIYAGGYNVQCLHYRVIVK